MDNPLLTPTTLPNFSHILPELIEPAVKQVIHQNREELTRILSQQKFTWNTLIQPLEDIGDRLSKVWSPVSHMHAVVESEALRTAYNACLPLLTEYHTEFLQNENLYQAIQSIAQSPEYATFTVAQRKVIDNDLRDFRLAGVHLSPTDKARFAELQKQLSKLTTTFSENLLDATQAWTLHVTDEKALQGLPEQTLEIAKLTAQQHNQAGFTFTLEYPCYSTVMKYLKNRELRRQMYEAYVARASDAGPNAGKFDNTDIMEQILRTRHELANLLGFNSFAEYSLATKMADTPERVLSFLDNLVEKSKAVGQQDIDELTEFAKSLEDIDQLAAWDLAYYSEKLREKKYALTQEELRAYFPVDKVLSGMFSVVTKLFGIKIVERSGVDTWHPEAQFFDVLDSSDHYIGSFYTDLYARPHKRDGAWMDECRVRRRLADGQLQYPVAFLTCNFLRPLDHKPALLTHDDVLTVFHEFGHCLHHLLTQVEYSSLSGINGVPWDAVEFPSQMLEYWCWEKETILLISSHHETGDSLPDDLFDKMIAAKNFQPGLNMLRQLEFALFDFRLHLEYEPLLSLQVQAKIDAVRRAVSVIKTPIFNRFQHSFSHIFAGGYAAGYYSYKWAEVLSADAYSLFEERGIFDRKTGQSFVDHILSQGGVGDPMKLFAAFRGREPAIDALLRYSGL